MIFKNLIPNLNYILTFNYKAYKTLLSIIAKKINMKSTIKFFFLVSVLFVVASCSKNPEKLLPKKDGTWTGTATTTLVGLGTFTDVVEYTFEKTTGTIKDDSGDITNFTWSYDKKNDALTVTQTDGTDVTVIVYTVSDVKKDSEKWEFTNGTINGDVITTSDYTQTVSLVRK